MSLAVGSRRELFVDTYFIEEMKGTSLKLHAPVPRENVLFFDKPWEGRYCGYVTLLQDQGQILAYYRGLPEAGKDGSNMEVTCLAHSQDGIHFERPNLELFEVNGSEKNNVVLAHNAPFSHNFSPWADEKPGLNRKERFKALAGTGKSGLVAFVSEDGIHWRKMQENPVLTQGAFDSQNVAFWSHPEGCYVAYFRTWSGGDYKDFRTVSRCTSQDFIHWSEPEVMTYGDRAPEHIYTNQTLPYFRAPHLYIATAARFMPGRRVISESQAQDLGADARYSGDCSDTVLMTSRGGARYDRTFMEGFIRPGLGESNWTSRTNYPARGIVPNSPEEMSMYVQRSYGQPTHHLQRLSMRTDGFTSVNAPYGTGEMLTKPFTFQGTHLILNFSTSAAGSLWVEVRDREGAILSGFSEKECDEILGDEIERAVTWKGSSDISSLQGRSIRLRFVMKDADLYSLYFQ